MSPRVALIADDLTGALDAIVPFAARGLRTVVCCGNDPLRSLEGVEADAIGLVSGTRDGPPEVAEARAQSFGKAVARMQPEILFRKIDSRMKGHPGLETRATAEAADCEQAVVCPAIPDMGRVVRAGRLVGDGVAEPIDIVGRMGWAGASFPDCESASDLDRIAATLTPGTLAVGARGFSAAIARRFEDISDNRREDWTGPVLVAVGSRDPITRAQVDALAAEGMLVVPAPGGVIPELPEDDLSTVVLAEGFAPLDPADAVRRFADSVASRLGARRHGLLVATGGETAAAILDRLGISRLTVLDEPCPGIVRVAPLDSGHRAMQIVTKSGGFGGPSALLDLVSAAGLLPVNPRAGSIWERKHG
ncbi:four-carbon acid sugar kinase family protein [Pelagovum pacificum]|uniref:Four-carbon acid sugar kinase family protein n=1 Tax=Pelagovum pacificum TaxID=2588711 RepID=A0A5C5GC56_9RHOB|nr:four-carbon acid sugar kinase family protein [Pelagovum pacificum]QQA42467.1 four-carbon acid sugar kinase family protein [Pelagovum pacificum]TNY31550.1 four-carbon acid sugar kinase family protein [Pelagovum pacificum]